MKKLLFLLLAVALLAAKDDANKKKPKPRFPLGKETTYVTGPLDAEGYIDYAAALNERLRRGVTPENNANVLLWKALGPHPEGRTMPDEFFKWLEIKSPPEKGDYFIPMSRFAREQLKVNPGRDVNAIDEELSRCSQRPWKAVEHPTIPAWLKANEKPLAVVAKGTKRTHYYSPLVPKRTKEGPAPLQNALMPGVQKCRELAAVFTARAMLSVGEKRFDDAWQDLLACHRLGRLVGRGPTNIDLLVGIAIDAVAAKADLVLLECVRLNREQINNCLHDLQKLPSMSLTADKVDLCERFVFLDIVRIVDRGGLEAMEALSGDRPPKAPGLMSKFFLAVIDWEPVLRNVNRWYDRMARTLRVENRDTREKQLNQIDEELRELHNKSRKPMDNVFHYLWASDSRKTIGEKVGDILIGLLVPAIHKVQNAADRREQVQYNLYLAFALAAYRREHGRYPKQLNALAPKYLDKIPTDMFSGKPLIYRPSENGYLLYSVGVNGQDEEGRSSDDDPPGDDLTINMPVPKLKQK